MESKGPIFPIPEPQHYSDYGFDPQIDYSHALREARKHSKREARPLDAFRFKLQKPISKDDCRRASKNKKRGWWWRDALLFWKRKGTGRNQAAATSAAATTYSSVTSPSLPYSYPYQVASSPVYMTECSAARTWTPSRRSGGGGWGGSSSETGEVKMPYLCLRDLAAMDASPSGPSLAACPSPAVPIYLVT